MNNLLESLQKKPIRNEPIVWVSRLIIYEQIEPKPIIIREIQFFRGLNIVSAEDNNDQISTIISGHSAGKTSLCRFIRYLLGENSYATENNTLLIKDNLPNGWIAGEIHVLGQLWAVRRPLYGKSCYVLQNATIEDLVSNTGQKITNSNYNRTIGLSNLLNDLKCKNVMPSGEQIKWGHVLSWCARDQETRLSNLHEWRAPSSNSDSPTFTHPKSGPLFTMRALLGLLQIEEIDSEEMIGKLENQIKQNSEELDLKRKEPKTSAEWSIKQLRKDLAQILKSDLGDIPYNSDNVTDITLNTLAARELKELQQTLEQARQDEALVQEEIDDLNLTCKEKTNDINQYELLIKISKIKYKNLSEGKLEKSEAQNKLELDLGYCTLAKILIKECQHIKKNVINFGEVLDNEMLKSVLTDLQDTITSLEASLVTIKENKAKLDCEVMLLKSNRSNISVSKRSLILQIDRLSRVIDTIDCLLKEIAESPTNPILINLITTGVELEKAIVSEKQRLKNLQMSFEEHSTLLSSIFKELVNMLLASGIYGSIVILEKGNLAFKVIQGQELGGEAINTLTILLADLACLIYNSLQSKSYLPDFLMHDSPREADMSLSLYSNYLRLVATLQAEYGENCPYQYIVTTTTPPPPEVRSFIRATLSAHPESEMLLRQQLKHSQIQFEM